MLSIEALKERIDNSELGREWINDPLMDRDDWPLKELGYTEEELRFTGYQNIHLLLF